MVFLENALASKFNPLVTLAKGSLKGFTNKFNGDAELLDDLVLICFSSRLQSELIVTLKNDHWTSKHNKVLVFFFGYVFGSQDFTRLSAIGSLNDFNNMP
jgi:hypothetical protein